MIIARTPSELPSNQAGVLGLVPTMGAFHEGHLSLMRAARSQCDVVVVSLFVNPTQFGPHEDYSRYPRDEQRDFELAAAEGVDVLFAPTVETMYPTRNVTIHVAGVSDRWEGERRPGHFDGVATIVCKLFHIVRPAVAFFGQKDYQQCAVIQAMVEGLDLGVALDFCETVREPSGLAMSSRNRYLTPEQLSKASALYGELRDAANAFSTAAPGYSTAIDDVVGPACERLSLQGFEMEYMALVDPRTLEPLQRLDGTGRLLAAGRLGPVRLLDNVPVTPSL